MQTQYGNTEQLYQLFGIGVTSIFVLLLLIVMISNIFIFRNAGYSGWEFIVPVYNKVCMLNMIGKPEKYILLLLIPYINSVFLIWLMYKFMKCFQLNILWFLLLILFPVIIYPIWAFSKKIQYEGC